MGISAEISVTRVTKGEGVPGLKKRTLPGSVKVGLLSGLGEHPNSDDGQTMAEIAMFQEFGTRHIPERPFLRTTIQERKSEYLAIMKSLLKRIMNGDMTVSDARKVLGLKAMADVQNKIVEISSPQNAEATIRKKNSSNPLIDTGAMKQSVSWDVVK